MAEKPKFIKHLAEHRSGRSGRSDRGGRSGRSGRSDRGGRSDKQKSEQPVNLELLKKQAMLVLKGKYEKAMEQGKKFRNDLDIEKAREKLNEARGCIEKIKDLKDKEPLIDELEEIIGPVAETHEEGDRTISEISATTPEGKEIKIELKKEAKHWNEFYEETGVDWAEAIPEDIKITAEEEKEMKRLIEELGFDKIIIIPDGLVGEPEFEEYEEEVEDPKTKVKKMETKLRVKKADQKYIDLHEKMSVGYADTYQGNNYKKDGGIGATKDKRKGLRIILTKEVQTLGEDELLKATKGKSIKDLEKGVTGLTEAEYLVWQKEYNKETGQHLDDWNKENVWTWLAGSERPVSGRVPVAYWFTDDDQVGFSSHATTNQVEYFGCRLAGSFKL